MTDSTTVGAAFGDALSNPRYFNGRKVIAREAARYKHQNPRISSLATSSVVDKVLLDDGSEVWQCRLCGDCSWDSVLGAVSHAGAHNRKPRTSKADAVETAEDTTPEVAGQSTRSRRVAAVPADLRGIVRNLTAIKVQLGHMQDAVDACAGEMIAYAEAATAGLSEDELAELREKAGKYDQMRGLFS